VPDDTRPAHDPESEIPQDSDRSHSSPGTVHDGEEHDTSIEKTAPLDPNQTTPLSGSGSIRDTTPMRAPRRMTLGSFRLEEKIGEGGMGVVYRAHDPQLRRWVAIKRIHTRYEEDEAYNRLFLGEARAVAAVNHPNIAQIFSIHPGAADEPSFFVMEYVEGQSADDKVKDKGPLPLVATIEIAIQAAQGLRAAYRNGIVHRDVKPSNLLLDAQDRVKLVDFGLALQVSEVEDSDGDQILCSPHYVSPEQARGWRVDHRSDMYSLGCTLYYLLTGLEPFRHENRVDLFVAHANEKPEPPSSHRPEIPASIDALILFLLEKRPEDRPHDYEALLEQCETILTELSPHRSRRKPRNRIAIGAAVLLAASIVGIAVGQQRRDPPVEVAQLFRGIHIDEHPHEKLYYDFKAEKLSQRHERIPTVSFSIQDLLEGTRAPLVEKGGLSWTNYDRPVRLADVFLSDFREIQLKGLLLLNRQHFRMRIGDDGTTENKNGIEINLSVDPSQAHDRVVSVTDRGENIPITTKPSLIDFKVKSEPYILTLARDPDPEENLAQFQFRLDQKKKDGTLANQASFTFTIPADRIPVGGVVFETNWPQRNRFTVKIEEILVKGRLDRAWLARQRADRWKS